jgi:GTP-binding protein
VPPPSGDPDDALQMLVNSIDYSPYLGRLGIGRISAGTLSINKDVVVARRNGDVIPARITKIYRFEGNERVPVKEARAGEIVAVAGMDEITVGETYTDPDDPRPLPATELDPPTLAMNFVPNDSPFTGRDGEYVTSRHLAERLRREALADVALLVTELGQGNGYRVAGRGELHLSILIERMRREGFEFQVTRPEVILREEEDGRMLEPYEEVTLDVADDYVGPVIEKLGVRKGQILTMETEHGMTRLVYKIPTRGLLGFRSEFLTDTKGMGVMNYIFAEYGPYAGEIRTRQRGVMVSMLTCTSVAYALFNLQDRGRLFIGPGVDVYKGQIVGEHCRAGDLTVNVAKGKKLTNMRAAGSDENVILTPPTEMALEECLTYIADDELVEITPKAIRLRKRKPPKF